MSVHHNRAEALREISAMPEQCFADGVLLDVPKRRRREQAMGTAMVRIQWPKEQKKRFATQYNRFVEKFGKDVGIEMLLRLLERPTDEALDEAVQSLGAT
jgi:hypothetical protein